MKRIPSFLAVIILIVLALFMIVGVYSLMAMTFVPLGYNPILIFSFAVIIVAIYVSCSKPPFKYLKECIKGRKQNEKGE